MVRKGGGVQEISTPPPPIPKIQLLYALSEIATLLLRCGKCSLRGTKTVWEKSSVGGGGGGSGGHEPTKLQTDDDDEKLELRAEEMRPERERKR